MSEEISRLKKDEADSAYFDTEAKGERSTDSWGDGYGSGLVFILIGIALLIGNYTTFSFHNWWALFFFIPAVGSFGKGLGSVIQNGYLSRSAAGAMSGSLFMLFLGGMFLFDLDWGTFWPAVLIVIGLGSVIKGMGR